MPTTDELTALLDDFAAILTNDPGPLDPGSAYYVPNLHGKDAEDVVQTLMRTIKRTAGSGMYYFSGQRGTGKSTELKRMTALLNADSMCRAYMVDALEFISDSHPIELTDLMLVTALAFADRLGEEAGDDFLAESTATRLFAWLKTEVEIKEVSFSGVKAEFKRQQQSVVQRIRDFDLARRERFVADCRDYLRDLGTYVRERHGVAKVVLVIDSLERLRGIGAAATDMFDRVVQVFDGGIDALRLPELQVVYSVPPYLPYLANVKQRVGISMLASVRVNEAPLTPAARRRPRPSGLATMRAVVGKRYSRWAEVFSEAALDRMILASGGDMRQLLRRLLLDVIDTAYYASDRLPLAADDPILQTVYDKHRVEFEQFVVQEEYPLLRNIADGHTVDLARRSDLPIAARFFDIRAVLNYRNGVDWVDLNPLLWPLIDAQAAAPAAAPQPADAVDGA